MVWRSVLVCAVVVACGETRAPGAAATGSDTHPAWAPDGRSIAFISNRDGVPDRAINFEVYVAGIDGTPERRLTVNDAFDADLAWSPDGRTILFKSYQDGNDEVYALEVASGAARNLTNAPASSEGGAVFSPDGRTILFASDRDSAGAAHLFLMDADGSNVRPLAGRPGPGHSAQWSPDGRRIAFVSGRDGRAQVYLANADGSAVRRLTDATVEVGYPRWSPDGSRIAYTAGSFATDRWSVMVMDADGGNGRVAVDSTDSGNAAWSPDGTRLVIGRYTRYGENGGDDSRLYVVPAGGGAPVALLTGR